MSEFELVTMRNRLERGKLNKAERGELFLRVPFGYIKLPSGGVALDPDEQVRAVVQLLFDKFDEQQAKYEAERAERQYQAVEPENRLVSRTLEQRWEAALAKLRQLEEEYDRFVREQPPALTARERARVSSLARDIPGLWTAPGTTPADRKEIVRCLIERVLVQVKKDSEYVAVTIHWHGGFSTQHEAIRPVRQYAQLRDYDELMARIVALRQEGNTAAQIAEQLNQEGFSPPKRRGAFYSEVVRTLLSRRGLANEKTCVEQLGTNEWWLRDLARAIPMSADKLTDWIRRGWLHARKTPAQGLWILWADRAEVKRLRKLQGNSRRGVVNYPTELTTPKNRTDQETKQSNRSEKAARR